MSFIYIRESVGEIIEPWGTPAFVEKDSDEAPPRAGSRGAYAPGGKF